MQSSVPRAIGMSHSLFGSTLDVRHVHPKTQRAPSSASVLPPPYYSYQGYEQYPQSDAMVAESYSGGWGPSSGSRYHTGGAAVPVPPGVYDPYAPQAAALPYYSAVQSFPTPAPSHSSGSYFPPAPSPTVAAPSVYGSYYFVPSGSSQYVPVYPSLQAAAPTPSHHSMYNWDGSMMVTPLLTSSGSSAPVSRRRVVSAPTASGYHTSNRPSYPPSGVWPCVLSTVVQCER